MATFDVYEARGQTVFWLDCQAETLSHLSRRFVVPLMWELDVAPISRLHPVFTIAGQRRFMATDLAGNIPARELGTRIGSLNHERYRILDAIDYLLSGT